MCVKQHEVCTLKAHTPMYEESYCKKLTPNYR